MKNNKIKVIFRKDKSGNIIAFFPEVTVNYGNIMSYMHIGLETKKTRVEEYNEILEELKRIYDDCELVVRQKIYYSDLRKAWV